MLHAHLPERVGAHSGGIQGVCPPGRRPVQDLETAAQEAAQKEAELGQETGRKEGGEETNAAPAAADGTRNGGGRAQDALREAAQEFEGLAKEFAVGGEGEGAVAEGEEASELREGGRIVSKVGGEARGFRGVKEGTGEVCGGRVRTGSYGRNGGGDCGGEWGGEGRVEDRRDEWSTTELI
jgi:hypothetical protein